MDFEFELGTQTSFSPRKAGEDTPFCIAILADFSGRGNRSLCEIGSSLAARRRIAVDVDNLELLPKQLGCELNVPLGGSDGPTVSIQFSEMSDFHPDRIFDRLEVFQKLKSLRNRLQAPATFAEAASQVRSLLAAPHEAGNPAPQEFPGSPVQEEPDADTIERLLGKSPSKKPPFSPAGRPVDIEKLIGEVVRPYIIPAPDPQQAELITQLDQAISGQMRAILHQPDFKELEAAWLLLRFIVSQVETNETLKIYIIDVSKAELAADLASCLGSTPSRDESPDGLQSTGTYRLLVERSVGIPGAEPYALLVGCYTFDQTSEDIALLHQLGLIAQAAGAPLVVAADSHFAGCPSLAATPDPNDWQRQSAPAALQLWQQLRGTPEAAYIGLLLPRFLLRLPYGSKTDPVERFSFEEFSPLAGHEQYLWGNSAGLCACLLANAFSESGWNLTDGLGCDLSGLPMHIYESDGQKHVTPCAETILTERAFGILIDKGLMPVVSVKGRDAVRLPRFQSIASPLAPLAGPWR
jgi:type VI secretion system protein ImpC